MYALQHHILDGRIATCCRRRARIFVGLVIAQNLSSFCEQWFLQLAGQRTMHGLRIAIFDHVLAQRAAFFDRIPVGRLMTRMTNDIESLNEMFAQGAITLIADAIKAIVIIVHHADDRCRAVADDVRDAAAPRRARRVRAPRDAQVVPPDPRAARRDERVRAGAPVRHPRVHLLGRGQIALREYDEINAGHRDAYLLQIRADAAMYALVEAIG